VVLDQTARAHRPHVAVAGARDGREGLTVGARRAPAPAARATRSRDAQVPFRVSDRIGCARMGELWRGHFVVEVRQAEGVVDGFRRRFRCVSPAIRGVVVVGRATTGAQQQRNPGRHPNLRELHGVHGSLSPGCWPRPPTRGGNRERKAASPLCRANWPSPRRIWVNARGAGAATSARSVPGPTPRPTTIPRTPARRTSTRRCWAC